MKTANEADRSCSVENAFDEVNDAFDDFHEYHDEKKKEGFENFDQDDLKRVVYAQTRVLSDKIDVLFGAMKRRTS
jgi:hypothetical protein